MRQRRATVLRYRKKGQTKDHDAMYEELAQRLAFAFISFQLHTTYQTAQRRYGHEPPGTYWIDLAKYVCTNILRRRRR